MNEGNDVYMEKKQTEGYKEFKKLFGAEKYDEIYGFLLENPGIKDDLSKEELRTMYDFVEVVPFKMMEEILKQTNSAISDLSKTVRELKDTIKIIK